MFNTKIAIVFLAFCLSACADADNNLRESSGMIVSMSPGNTEILFALGLGDRVIGVTDFCDYPEQARAVDSIGSFSNPSLEKIISLNPDLVLAAGPPQMHIIKQLSDMGFAVEIINPSSFKELYDGIERIGELSGSSQNALGLVSDIKKKIERVRDFVPDSGRKSVFVEISSRPMMTAGSQSYINSIIDAAGGINSAADIRKDYLNVGIEYIIEKDPDIILILSLEDPDRKDNLKKKLGDSVKASRTGSVYDIENKDIFIRPGPRVALAVEILADIMRRSE